MVLYDKKSWNIASKNVVPQYLQKDETKNKWCFGGNLFALWSPRALMCNKQPRHAAQRRTGTSLCTAPQATSATSSIQEILLPAFPTEDSASSNVATLVRSNSSQQFASMWDGVSCIHSRGLSFVDGRGLRHKYFKDYKDYLGRWGNVDNVEVICSLSEVGTWGGLTPSYNHYVANRYQF